VKHVTPGKIIENGKSNVRCLITNKFDITSRLITNINRCKILNTSAKIIVAPAVIRAEIGRTKIQFVFY
jgi:hypothetical protein